MGGKVLAMLKGGGEHKKFRVVSTKYLEILAILKGGHKKFPLFKRGGGGGFSHFVPLPTPVINDQSLSLMP